MMNWRKFKKAKKKQPIAKQDKTVLPKDSAEPSRRIAVTHREGLYRISVSDEFQISEIVLTADEMASLKGKLK